MYVDSLDEAERIIVNTENLDKLLILRGASSKNQEHMNEFIQEKGAVKILNATVNEIIIETNITSASPTWLVYADAFHPCWRATVNGKEVKIDEAYMAFKAVRIDHGKSIVRFTVSNGFDQILSTFIAYAGAIFCLYILYLCLILIIPIKLDAIDKTNPRHVSTSNSTDKKNQFS